MTAREEKHLIEATEHGDSDAFSALVRKYDCDSGCLSADDGFPDDFREVLV